MFKTKLIKTTKAILTKFITLIINQMLNTGIFPDQLKMAKITPIYKKECGTLFTNYRPILLLSAISNVFEKVIFLQVYIFFQEKKLLYCAQYHFHKEHSTEFAAFELVDKIILNMDKMETPIGIFLDLSKAFDTLDHEILLYKLKYYGFNCNALNLMKSYLTNHKQFLQIDHTQSNFSNIITGVP